MNTQRFIIQVLLIMIAGGNAMLQGQWKCGHCAPRARVEPVDFGYPYGQEWGFANYIEVPLPYRNERGKMFAFGWRR